MAERKPYPTDVSDEEWSFAAPYLSLMNEDAPQRRYELREMFNALRWMARAGASWRMLPTNFPPREMVYQQTQRWLTAGLGCKQFWKCHYLTKTLFKFGKPRISTART